MTIRSAGPREAAALSALAIRSKAHWGYDAEEMSVFEGELTLAPEALAPRDATVVEEDGVLLGFYTLLEHEDGVLELEHLFVEPSHLRRGLGSRLLRHALRRAAGRGVSKLIVLSDPNATEFYLAHGATVVEEIPSSIPGRSIPRLVLPLAGVAGDHPEAPGS